LTKQPFYRLSNGGREAQAYNKPMYVDQMKYQERRLMGSTMSQADYLEEYYPFSHRVMSDFYFPEFYNYSTKTGDDGKEEIVWNREETFRIGSTLQCVITVQQLVHLCGNDIHFELTDETIEQRTEQLFKQYQKGWLRQDMEVAFYKFAESIKITADGAIVFYLANGRMGARVMSFLNGDTLYPHYDPITGEMTRFARKFSSYDEDGKEVISWVEVWDDTYLTRYKQTKTGITGMVNGLKDYFGMDGYEVVFRGRHGYSRIPVVYMRDKDNGPCWNNVQCLIDDYEVALSYFAKNNAGAALPSYKLKGDSVDIEGDPLGRIRAFTMGKDDDVSIIQPQGLSENYTQYITYVLDEIFRGAFIVKQPELKSGDTPTGTMKLYYAPSLDKAELECKEYKHSITQMQSLFCEGFGIQEGMVTEFMNLDDHIFGFQLPFIHENTSTLIADLVASKNAGILSAETASEHNPYSNNGEYRRVIGEVKQQQQADRLYQLKASRAAIANT
jgi:hypothetical protein